MAKKSPTAKVFKFCLFVAVPALLAVGLGMGLRIYSTLDFGGGSRAELSEKVTFPGDLTSLDLELTQEEIAGVNRAMRRWEGTIDSVEVHLRRGPKPSVARSLDCFLLLGGSGERKVVARSRMVSRRGLPGYLRSRINEAGESLSKTAPTVKTIFL